MKFLVDSHNYLPNDADFAIIQSHAKKIQNIFHRMINRTVTREKRRNMVRALQELNSDYVPLLMYHSNKPQLTDASTLTIGKTNWEEFKKKLDKQINCNMRFKSTEDIEKAMKKFTKIIQTTATLTPTTTKVAYKFNENSNNNHTKTATQQAQQKADQEAQHNKFETYLTSRGTMKETKAINYGEQLKTLKGQRGKNLF
ncbi:RNA-directed DNA polymerase from mobile element jockey-like, partial [Vespula maculifrons]